MKVGSIFKSLTPPKPKPSIGLSKKEKSLAPPKMGSCEDANIHIHIHVDENKSNEELAKIIYDKIQLNQRMRGIL